MRPNPCIALCTVLYDDRCKGCGRTYLEVAQWNSLTEDEKETIWVRIETEATAWRFNRHKDRANLNQHKMGL